MNIRSLFHASIISSSLALLVACSPSDEDDNQFPQGASSTSGSSTGSGSPTASSSGGPTASSSGSPTSSSGAPTGSSKTPVAFKTVNPGNCHMSYDGKEHDGNDTSTPPTGGSDGHTLEVSCIYVEGGIAMSAVISMDSVNGPGTYDVGTDSFGTAVFSTIDAPGAPASTHTSTQFRVTLSKVRDGHAIGGAELTINGKPAIVSFDLAHK